jgi:pimeloyl-ACP methyl ester carboxylesterase
MMNTNILVGQNNFTSQQNQDRKQLLSNLPVTERNLVLAGISTSVLEGGQGAPIILLHGQGEFAITWMRIFNDLVETHKIIVPDLPGHGDTSIPKDALDSGQLMNWLDALIEKTCERPPVLVGHLLGGSIAARYAAKNNNRIEKLILVDSMGLAWYRPTLKFTVAMVGHIARPSEKTQERLFDGCFTDFAGLKEEISDSWEYLSGYALDRARKPEMKSALQSMMPKLGVPAISKKDLEKISVPTTMIWGRHDLQVNLSVAEKANKRYGWPLYIIDHAADDPAFEQPENFITAFRSAL